MTPAHLVQQPPSPPGPKVDVHVDLSGLADPIWRSLPHHLDELGSAMLSSLDHALRNAAHALWDALWHSSANILTQIPPDLSYNFGPYRAIATDPMPLAVGGATLALVLLGLRIVASSIVGGDRVATHILTRLVPAVFLTLAYPALVARGISLVNSAAEALGSRAIETGFLSGIDGLNALSPPAMWLEIPYLLLWLVLVYFGIRLLGRLAYALFRLLVALVFGPLALILWAIPQTEWVTWFWLRELVGWATTPLLVTACLAMVVPLAGGRYGLLGGIVFGIAGTQAAYDLVGLLAVAPRSGNLLHGASREVAAGLELIAQERRAAAAIKVARELSERSQSRSHGRYGSR